MTGLRVRLNTLATRRIGNVAMCAVALAYSSAACAQESGRVDSSNVGVAIEDAVISSGLPDANLDIRQFNESLHQQLMNTASPDYPSPAAGAAAQEYMIFKFDFSSLPSGAQAIAPAHFDFSAWFTQGEGAPDEAIYGRFKLFEITGGDGAWTDRFVSEGVENSNPVTWSSLNGSFVELSGVAEDDTPPPDNASGNPFGPLYPGLLASNGGFDGANRVAGIPVETINRLISGQSIGLAMGSVSPAPTPLSGDYNGNSQVDGRDMCLWQRELGNTVDPGTGADGNGNGQVDAADLDVWADHFGAASNASAGTTNFSIHTTESFFSPLSAPTLNFDWAAPMASTHVVPEPSVGSILVVVAALPVARRGRSAS